MTWYRYMDMSSGGDQKTEWGHIYVEADTRGEADAVFEDRTGRSPYYVTCSCCGEDYSVTEDATLEEASEYDRRDKRNPVRFMSVDEYAARPDVLIIRKYGGLMGQLRAAIDRLERENPGARIWFDEETQSIRVEATASVEYVTAKAEVEP